MTLVLISLIAVALIFDFLNGLHDAANSIATVVSTGVLRPHQAVLLAAFFNFVAIFIFHLKVAATVGRNKSKGGGIAGPDRGINRASVISTPPGACRLAIAVPLTLKFTYVPPNMRVGFMARTNEPILPRVTLSVLWTVTTACVTTVAAPCMGSGPPSGFCTALVTGASANASADTMVMNMVF